MKNNILKKIIGFAGIILLFIAISYAFVPQVLSGQIVNQSDIAGWTGMAQESVEYNNTHPEDPTYWTNSMFGGMPTVSISAQFKGDWTNWLYNLLLAGARPATYLFVSLLGGFLLMLAFGIRPVLAIGGAIAITFCSYNLQIIQVGHNTKMQAIAYMPWVIAAMVFTYRSALENLSENKTRRLVKTLLGSVLFAFALSFQIKANHPQISYYLAIIVFVFVIALFIKLLTLKEKKKYISGFFIASALLLTVGITGIATNLNKLMPTYEYAEYSMRGGSELTSAESGHNNGGLSLEYATAWSYGIEETLNLMIPNFNGGASSTDPGLKNSATRELLRQAGQPHLEEVMKSLPMYWGPQPFTAGPMYIGAISIFLFILGLFLLKGRDKWWIAAATLLAVFLSWGSHFLWFTKFWYESVPLYDKFRTVSMALVILQVTIPLLAFLTLEKILKHEFDTKKVTSALIATTGIAGGVCLLFFLFPSVAGSFNAASDRGMQDILVEALIQDRKAMLSNDALRSLIFVVIAAGLIFYAIKSQKGQMSKKTGLIVSTIFCILMIADFFPVGKRYLNADHFVSPRSFSSQFTQRPADKMILADKSPEYRVLDLTVNIFNDSHPSYWHKNIGGYSPAKLQRYQDLIEHYLSKEINTVMHSLNSSETVMEAEENLPEIPVISMLNTKYFIVGADNRPIVNHQAMGNCWFADDFVNADNPDQEIALLGKTDLRHYAVIGDDFSWASDKISRIKKENEGKAEELSEDSVILTEYAPNRLRYKCSLSSERAVVFSEIFYPKGWKATADGKETDLFRADWILRGAILPAGEYEFVMSFEPEVYKKGETLSRASSISLFVLLVLSGAGLIYFRKKE